MSHTSHGKRQHGIDPALPHQMTPLLRALAADRQAPITCAECRRQWSALYHLMQTEEPLPDEYQIYAYHLQTCGDCAAGFAALTEALAELDAGTLPELDRMPHFDLSFLDDAVETDEATELQAATMPSTAPWLAPLADGLRRLAGEIAILVQPGRARFGALPAPLSPLPATGALFRSEVDEGKAEVLVLPAPDAGLSVHLTVGPVVAGRAAIAVKLLEMATTEPLAGTRITLRNSERQLLAGAVTGVDGTALFEQLPLGRYGVQVRHREQTWEIALLIIEEKPAA